MGWIMTGDVVCEVCARSLRGAARHGTLKGIGLGPAGQYTW